MSRFPFRLGISLTLLLSSLSVLVGSALPASAARPLRLQSISVDGRPSTSDGAQL